MVFGHVFDGLCVAIIIAYAIAMILSTILYYIIQDRCPVCGSTKGHRFYCTASIQDNIY